MDESLERALLVNIKGALGLSRDLNGHEAKRILRVMLYTLKREGFAVSRVYQPFNATNPFNTINVKANHAARTSGVAEPLG